MSEKDPALVVYWVSWIDSATVNGGRWTRIDDDDIRPVDCVATGFMVRDEPDWIALAGQLDGHENAGDILVIPRVAIKLMKAWTPEGTP